MPLTEDAVREELKKVVDPELFINIVDLGLVYTVNLKRATTDRTDIGIEMTMTSPFCPAAPQLMSGCKLVLKQLPEVNEVAVKLVMDPPWSPDKMTEEAGSAGHLLRPHVGLPEASYLTLDAPAGLLPGRTFGVR